MAPFTSTIAELLIWLTSRIDSSKLSTLCGAQRHGEAVLVRLFEPALADDAACEAFARMVVRKNLPPGCAPCLEAGFVQGRLGIVWGESEGVPIARAMHRLESREVQLPLTVALAVAVDLLEIVENAHATQLFHGALTAASVWVRPNGSLVIGDFGLWRAIASCRPLRNAWLEQGGAAEVPTSERPPTAPVDTFAIGLLLYRLLTLRPAYGRAEYAGNKAVVAPSQLVRRVGQKLDALVLRAIERDPSRRFQRASDFAFGLREFLSSQGGLPSRQDLAKYLGHLMEKPEETNSEPFPVEGAFEFQAGAPVSTLAESPFGNERADTQTGGPEVQPRTTEPELALAEPFAAQPALESDTDWDTPLGLSRVTVAAAPNPIAAKSHRSLAPVPEAPVPPGLVDEDDTVAEHEASAQRVLDRIRPREDFDTVKPAPKGPIIRHAGPIPARTKMTFAVPGQRDTIDMPSQLALAQVRAIRRRRWSAFLGTIALLSMVLGMVGFWWVRTPDKRGRLIAYLPAPIGRLLAPVESAPAEGELRERCYRAEPTATYGFVSITVVQAADVKIDDVMVCGGVTRVPVSVGTHSVRVVNRKTKREFAQSVRSESGKTVVINVPF